MSYIGRFSCGKFQTFLPKFKSRNLVTIARKMLPSITMLKFSCALSFSGTELRQCVRLLYLHLWLPCMVITIKHEKSHDVQL